MSAPIACEANMKYHIEGLNHVDEQDKINKTKPTRRNTPNERDNQRNETCTPINNKNKKRSILILSRGSTSTQRNFKTRKHSMHLKIVILQVSQIQQLTLEGKEASLVCPKINSNAASCQDRKKKILISIWLRFQNLTS
ncbi:hypothetical protein Droror1_Dr00020397 [Drosera rotundifolia]